jgi:hypothetical protein
MRYLYSYDYKLPSWCMKRVAAQQSAAQHNTTSYFRHGVFICLLAKCGDKVVSRSADMRFEELMRQPVELIASEPITRVKLYAAGWERGVTVRSAMVNVSHEYVKFHTHVRVCYSPSLRAAALRAIARAYR